MYVLLLHKDLSIEGAVVPGLLLCSKAQEQQHPLLKGLYYYIHIYVSDLDLVCMYTVYQGVHQVWYQGGVKATVSGVVEDLKFKISEGSDQTWCFPDSAQLAVSAKLRQLTGQSQENTNFGRSLLKF